MREGIKDRAGFIWGIVMKDDATFAPETAGEPGTQKQAAIVDSLADFDRKLLPVLTLLKIS